MGSRLLWSSPRQRDLQAQGLPRTSGRLPQLPPPTVSSCSAAIASKRSLECSNTPSRVSSCVPQLYSQQIHITFRRFPGSSHRAASFLHPCGGALQRAYNSCPNFTPSGSLERKDRPYPGPDTLRCDILMAFWPSSRWPSLPLVLALSVFRCSPSRSFASPIPSPNIFLPATQLCTITAKPKLKGTVEPHAPFE